MGQWEIFMYDIYIYIYIYRNRNKKRKSNKIPNEIKKEKYNTTNGTDGVLGSRVKCLILLL